ncbi:MAG: methyltransferase domain-containing protein [Acidimicrobiia bacterium]|nr:methyltransferase domain-containing protein [Acidimicrobiia bacterium]
MDPLIPAEIDRHYSDLYAESQRLSEDGLGRIELIRTKEILVRYLPEAPAEILDIGGGPGVYSVWLTSLGHRPTLIDPVALHVQQAREAGVPSAELGVAGQLEFTDDSFDAVLMFGPLYHLQERSDRLAALREAHRVLRQGGLLFVAGITRYASAIDGLDSGFIDHEDFERTVHVDLATGKHTNHTADPRFFTTAYFHLPDELVGELEATGFTDVEIVAVEGMSWAARDLEERISDPDKLRAVLDLLRRLESAPSLLGATPHFLAIGRT